MKTLKQVLRAQGVWDNTWSPLIGREIYVVSPKSGTVVRATIRAYCGRRCNKRLKQPIYGVHGFGYCEGPDSDFCWLWRDEFILVTQPSIEGVCNVCGCMDGSACVDAHGLTCSWADRAHTLCSFCASPLFDRFIAEKGDQAYPRFTRKGWTG